MSSQKASQERRLELFTQLLEGTLSDDEKVELNALLKSDDAARQHYRAHMRLHAQLHLAYTAGGMPSGMPPLKGAQQNQTEATSQRILPFRTMLRLAAAALVLLGIGALFQSRESGFVATLLSSEDAAWESALPTAPHSKLKPGHLELKSGLATIQFNSGATVTIEAPARLELLTPMRGRMSVGSAVIDVPKAAIGFIMEAPNSYVVDHGTRFAMSVDKSGKSTAFEVLSGEISVHHPGAKLEERLFQKQATIATEGGLERTENPFSKPNTTPTEPALRIGSAGKTKSIIASNRPEQTNPRMLMVKTTEEKNSQSERRSFISFDLTGADLSGYTAAKLRLNLVPSHQGLVAYVPQEIRFLVYGITDAHELDWNTSWNWETSPKPEGGLLLGSIDILRTQQSGNVELASPALLDFLKTHRDKPILLLVVRDTRAPASGSLVHAFASDSHPQAPGPVLEFFAGPEH
ncbi:MAG: iron dicitrate transport regulator FecR [Verrucomicrobiota bacterium]